MTSRQAFLISTLALALAACGRTGTATPTEPAATSGTINGVRVIDASTYQFGFTPLAGTQIAPAVTLKDVQVTDLSAGQATAQVCGQVQVQDVVTATISLDSTGSMLTTDPNKLRNTAAKAFVSRMTSADRSAVLSFDGTTTPSSGFLASRLWQNFTADKGLLNAGIDQATFASGNTPLYDAIVDASTYLSTSGGLNPRALILTDGEDNAGANWPSDVVSTALRNRTPLYIIGLDASNSLDFTEAENIATQTGGLFQKATDASQLGQFFDNMYNAFRAQGCVQVAFTRKPSTGTTVTGNLKITVTAADRKDATIVTPFTLEVR